MDYSVLMSVYYKEKPEHLRQSINSMIHQSVPTNDFVLICDGPLGAELNAVVDEMQQQYPAILHVFRLEKNMGLGSALNYGMQYCRNSLVARMDSDDIARSDRCKRQLEIFEQKPDVGMVSGIVEEFTDSPERVDARRVPPESHEEIIRFAKKRNPFNHPCIMFRKEEVEKAGGYQELFLLEDYFLWIRMLLNGTQGYNVQVPLLWMRTGNGMYKRRSGMRYIKSQRWLFQYMYKKRFITARECWAACMIRLLSSVLPTCFRKQFFLWRLRG